MFTEFQQKEDVHNVHTLGFGPGRSGAGRPDGRIAEGSVGAAEIQGPQTGRRSTG